MLFIILALVCSSIVLTAAGENVAPKYQIPQLLKPQLGFEINLYFPNLVLAQVLPPSLLLSVEYLVDNQAPFRLYYNFARQTQPSLIIRSSRHAKHQVTHLVFLTLQPTKSQVDLRLAFEACLYHNGFVSSAIHEDFIQVIADGSNLKDEQWKITHYTNDQQAYFPLYFIVLYWWCRYGFRVPTPVLVRETRCRSSTPPEYRSGEDIRRKRNGNAHE